MRKHIVTDAKLLCLEIYRMGQIIAAFKIPRKIFLITALKKRKPRNEYEKALSRNIQSGTGPLLQGRIGPLDLQSNTLPLRYAKAVLKNRPRQSFDDVTKGGKAFLLAFAL
ncbi:hypothetical protein TNCV_2019241 [Trichonephila clavipes]|nr:hypothetical protein TNCV_2019241 [Trichonephila clavipes]